MFEDLISEDDELLAEALETAKYIFRKHIGREPSPGEIEVLTESLKKEMGND